MQLLYLLLMAPQGAQAAPRGESAIYEFAFLSLSLSHCLSLLRNPGLTHAILIFLLRDNHDPEEEIEPQTHSGLFSHLFRTVLIFQLL